MKRETEPIEMECEECHQAPDDNALSPCPEEECPSTKLMCWDCLFQHSTEHGGRGQLVDYRREKMCEVCDGAPDEDGLDMCGNCLDDREMCSSCLSEHEETCWPRDDEDEDDEDD